MAKIEVRGVYMRSLYVNGQFIKSFEADESQLAYFVAERLTQALALPDPSVATAQNSQLPEAKPVDREFLHKYLQTLQSLLVTPAAVDALTQNVLKVDIQAVLDMLRSAAGLPTRPLLVPGYVVPVVAEDEKSAKNLGSTSTPSTPNVTKEKEPGAHFEPHPDVIAWKEWKRSLEGVATCKVTAQGTYLENRLRHAFMAGRDSFRSEVTDAIKKVRQ